MVPVRFDPYGFWTTSATKDNDTKDNDNREHENYEARTSEQISFNGSVICYAFSWYY